MVFVVRVMRWRPFLVASVATFVVEKTNHRSYSRLRLREMTRKRGVFVHVAFFGPGIIPGLWLRATLLQPNLSAGYPPGMNSPARWCRDLWFSPGRKRKTPAGVAGESRGIGRAQMPPGLKCHRGSRGGGTLHRRVRLGRRCQRGLDLCQELFQRLPAAQFDHTGREIVDASR